MVNCEATVDAVSLRLYELLVSGAGLQSIASEAQAALNNPLIVIDRSCKVLFSSGLSEAAVKPPWNSIEKDRYYPPSYFSFLAGKNDDCGKFALLYTLEEPSFFDTAGSGHRLLVFRIGSAAMPFGFAALLEINGPIGEAERKIFSLLCKILATELRVSASAAIAAKRTHEYILADILNGKLYGDQLRQQLIAVNIEPRRSRCLFVVEKDGPSQPPIEYVRDSLENMLHKCKSFIYNDKLVLLFEFSGNLLLTHDERSQFKAFLTANGLVCGGSGRFLSMNSLPSAYTQAVTATRIGKQMEGRGPIYYLWEYVTYHMCDLLHNEQNLFDFCNPMLLCIKRYDEDNRTCFMPTIRAYLKSGRNPAKTASLLGIHRNSVDYRLKRMQELFDLDLGDPNIMFSFEQSLQIIDYLEKNQ